MANLTDITGDVAVERNAAVGGDVVVQGHGTIKHNLKVEGWFEAKNVKGAIKGVFTTAQALAAAYPAPEDGWMALVGTGTPFAVYVGVGGTWTATGGTADVTIDLSDYAGSDIGGLFDQGEFLGIANPSAGPTLTPKLRQWYITHESDTSVDACNYLGFGSAGELSFRAERYSQWIFYWTGEEWGHIRLVRGSIPTGGGAVGEGTRIGIPETEDEVSEDNPRIVPVIDPDDVADVVAYDRDRGTVSSEIDAEGCIQITDALAHNVWIVLDSTYGTGTPESFDGIEAAEIELPNGILTFDAPVGVSTTTVILPETVNYISAASVSNTSAATLQLKGAPPQLGTGINWSHYDKVVVPKQYEALYQVNQAWNTALATVVNNGGVVKTEDNVDYVPLAPTRYEYQQTVADTKWEVGHPLNCYPSVTVTDGGRKTLECSVVYVSKSKITITLNEAATGWVFLN